MNLSRSLAVGLAAAGAFAAAPLSAQTVFNNFNFPGPVLPGNVVSQCLECNQLNSLGQVITGTQGGTISSFSFILSSWAVTTDYGNAASFTLPITLDVYNVGAGNSIGSLLYSMTQNVVVPFRPAVWPFSGIASQVTFNPVGFNVGAQFAYTLAFSTGGFGPAPTGYATPNPANSLNFGVGYLNPPLLGTVDAFAYDGSGNSGLQSYPVNSDGPLGDDGYTMYTKVDMATVTPEPASLVLLGTGLLGIGGVISRRRKTRSV